MAPQLPAGGAAPGRGGAQRRLPRSTSFASRRTTPRGRRPCTIITSTRCGPVTRPRYVYRRTRGGKTGRAPLPATAPGASTAKTTSPASARPTRFLRPPSRHIYILPLPLVFPGGAPHFLHEDLHASSPITRALCVYTPTTRPSHTSLPLHRTPGSDSDMAGARPPRRHLAASLSPPSSCDQKCSRRYSVRASPYCTRSDCV